VPASGATYLDQTDATTYFANSFKSTAWAALSSTEKDTALAEATRWLETLCWKGEKCDPAQPLAWPRKVDATKCCTEATCITLPPAMVQAVAELALALHSNQGAMIGTTVATAAVGPVKRQKLDALEVEYFDPRSGASTATNALAPSGPLVLQKFSWLRDLLKCYVDLGAGNLIRRVRS
jgi:hypothetical protein